MRNVAVVAMTKNMADELGPHGINVTVVHPGLTRTEKTPGVVAATAERQGISEADAEKRMVNNLVGRWIDARDIASVVTFLASPKAAAINGDVLGDEELVPLAQAATLEILHSTIMKDPDAQTFEARLKVLAGASPEDGSAIGAAAQVAQVLLDAWEHARQLEA
jgi:hypothetical protein